MFASNITTSCSSSTAISEQGTSLSEKIEKLKRGKEVICTLDELCSLKIDKETSISHHPDLKGWKVDYETSDGKNYRLSASLSEKAIEGVALDYFTYLGEADSMITKKCASSSLPETYTITLIHGLGNSKPLDNLEKIFASKVLFPMEKDFPAPIGWLRQLIRTQENDSYGIDLRDRLTSKSDSKVQEALKYLTSRYRRVTNWFSKESGTLYQRNISLTFVLDRQRLKELEEKADVLFALYQNGDGYFIPQPVPLAYVSQISASCKCIDDVQKLAEKYHITIPIVKQGN